MATPVTIQLRLEDSGVITGLRAVGGELDNLKTHAATGAAGASQAMDGLDKNTQKSIDSARLLENTFGVALPRTLTKIISQSEALAGALSAAFNVSVVLALGAAAVMVSGKLAAFALEAGGYTKAMQESYANAVKANNDLLVNPKTLANAKQNEQSLQRQIEEKNRLIISLGKEDALDYLIMGYGQVATKAAEERLSLQDQLTLAVAAEGVMQKEIAAHLTAQASAVAVIGLQGYAAINEQRRQAGLQNQSLKNAGLLSPDQFTSANQLADTAQQRATAALSKQNAETTRKQNDEAVQAWLSGVDLIVAKEKSGEQDLVDLRKNDLILATDLAQRKADLQAKAEAEITKNLMDEADKRGQAEQDVLEMLRQSMAETAASTVQGFGKMRGAQDQFDTNLARVDANTQKALGSLGAQFEKTAGRLVGDQMTNALGRLTEAEVAIIKKGEEEKAQIRRDYELRRQSELNQTLQMQETAAIAIVPPWERADMEIAASAAQRIREINLQQQSGVIGSADAAARTAAVWQDSAGKVLDSWTSAFEDLFNGGWSQTIQKLAKQFMARIAAELTLSSGLSGILGPMLGLPSGVPGTTNAGFGTMFGGGTSALGSLGALGFGGGGSTAAASGFPLLMGGGTTGTGLTPFLGAGGAAGLLSGGGAPGMTLDQQIAAQGTVNQLLGVPGLSAAGLAGGGGKGIFSIAGLGSMLPMGAALLGGKLGGMTGGIGAGLLGMMAFSSQGGVAAMNAAMWLSHTLGISLGAAAGLIAGAGGGLLGYGVGQQYGTLAGVGSGAGTGALLGFMFGGPIGALIGGILGLLGGLFGGLGGGSARTKAAQKFTDQEKAAADQIEAQFKAFQLDYPTALADLEQIKSNAYDQMRKLKSEGTRYYNRDLAPYIDKIEAELKGYQDQRDRRMTLAFAPPQFALGGTVTGYGGGVPIVAHPGEEIINPDASARNRPLLKAINSGASFSTGGDTYVFQISAMDARSFESWLRNSGGGDAIAHYARGRRLEGRGF